MLKYAFNTSNIKTMTFIDLQPFFLVFIGFEVRPLNDEITH